MFAVRNLDSAEPRRNSVVMDARVAVIQSCGGTSSSAIYAGYYESWNKQRPCDVIHPSDIDVSPWTHLYYSFALISSDDSTITTMNSWDEEYYAAFTALKQKKPSLKTYISVGGWDAGGEVFSTMVRFPGTRSAFINSAIAMMEKYGFDGIDIDWEYPAAEDRGGNTLDTARLVTFLSELKTACGDTYGLTATLPSSYWYLKGFDVEGMSQYVDWFNFMSYDIHGTWDGDSEFTSPDINPHTNLTEITDGLNLLWRNNVDPSKVALGLGFYGRSFTLESADCNTPGCPFRQNGTNGGGGNAGSCTGTSGIMSDYEVSRILKNYGPEVVYDEVAAVNWITWATNQWISFDNAKTLRQKADFANSKCLGGLFGWALDLGGPGSLTNPNSLSLDDTSVDGANPDGSSGGSGDVYIDPGIYSSKNPTVTCVPPCNLILPPWTLPSFTTITFPDYETSLEVAWTTTITTTISEVATVITTIARTVETTTIPIPPVITNIIDVWNWNITIPSATVTTYHPVSSILPPPITIIDDPNPASITGVVHPPVTRTITVPPYPYQSDDIDPFFPTITFTTGPPGPSCTGGCGHKCHIFCGGPCLTDCDGGNNSNDFNDPVDPDPPKTHVHCKGPDCVNGVCTGPLCIKVGCVGSSCSDSLCLGGDCSPRYCHGDSCDSTCSGSDCQTSGCIGDDCNGSGFCFGLQCLSWGCLGPNCGPDLICIGPDCTEVSCTGPGCEDGICTGPGCESEDEDCEPEEAPFCTEFVYSTVIAPATTSTRTTSEACRTITACGATATTTTTTRDEEDMTMTVSDIMRQASIDLDALSSAAASIKSKESSWLSEGITTTSTTTTKSTTTSTTKTTTTTSASPTASEVSYSCKGSSRCGSFSNLRSFCNVAKAYLRGNDLYGTLDSDSNTGACYTDGKNAGFGCGVFVSGSGCEMDGNTMAAAYDHLHNSDEGDCGICGSVTFSDGCLLKVDYVGGCQTTLDGPLQVAPPLSNVTSNGTVAARGGEWFV
ncbi:hypothetical protein N7486_011267 [Penicillium sp. IBT 16267x]|nr:hypothetical protein N7486_011267 [Penicillium sp. IBT 16267x]